MFEEVNNLSNGFQSYGPELMLKSWLCTPNHRFHILHPAVNELFEKLDEELLIGEKPELENWWEGTGISDTVIYEGSGDYIGI